MHRSTRSLRLLLVLFFAGLGLRSLSSFVLAQAHPVAAPAFTVPRRVAIVDANNTPLGEAHIVGLQDVFLLLALNDGQDFLTLPITPAGFATLGVFDIGVAFTTADCTGQAYLVHISPDFFATEAIITAPGHTLWVREPDAVPEPVTLQSYVNTDCWRWYAPDVWSLRARPVVDLDTLYTPPFRLQVPPRPVPK